VRSLIAGIGRRVRGPCAIMEVCGGQTHTLIRTGLDRMLPAGITMIHGPGCPVCVTPLELIDQALVIARRPDVIFTSFGDMMRVPGSETDLLSVKAAGGDVRIVYSPLDAVRLAQRHPDREVVFFAVGFETTAPANASAVWRAKRLGLRNFSILCSQVMVPPALEAILSAPDCGVDAIIAAGHVCAIMGYEEYEPIAARHRVPIVVTGFEPLDLLEGILMAVTALADGRWGVENQYARAVTRPGNRRAQALITEVFEVTDRNWRGIGPIAASGLALTAAYRQFDAALRFGTTELRKREHPDCIAGAILRGKRKPDDCPAFGSACTPLRPLGAPMVSSEGACAAYYHSGRVACRT
jgi:hydrogenase expression/formation protein HypD